MSETKPSEMRPKKVVGRSVAIGLGIICIVLVAGLGVVMAYYAMQINIKDSTYNDYVSTHRYADSYYNSLNSQISQLNSNITNMQTQINILNATANLEFSKFWESGNFVATTPENLGGIFYLNSSIVPYAGYVKVDVEPSNNTYVRVLYDSNGTSFDYEVPVNANGTGIIPVLPTNFINIGVGNLTIGTAYTTNFTYYY